MAAAVGSPDVDAGEVPVAYVQPKPGAAISERQLLDFAAAHIPGRAAPTLNGRSVPVVGLVWETLSCGARSWRYACRIWILAMVI